MKPGPVSLVFIKPVYRKFPVVVHHHTITGHLRQNGSSRNTETAVVTFNDSRFINPLT